MGMGGISIWQLLIILVIVLVLFGTKRLRNLGTDLGSAVKGFRSAMSEAEPPEGTAEAKSKAQLSAQAEDDATVVEPARQPAESRR